MSTQSVRLRLATLQATIPGIARAYTQLPRGMIKTAELPLFLNFVRNATYDENVLGQDDVQVSRDFMMWLMVKPVAEGEEGEGEALVEPYIDAVVSFFLARPSLNNLAGVQNARIVEDSGPKRMVWPGTPTNPLGVYWGAEFRLNVTEVIMRTYNLNE